MNKKELNEKFGITDEKIENWANEYEFSDWSDMEFSKPVYGRPRIFEEPMDRISVTLPRGAVVAMKDYCNEQNISRSELVRRAISRELASV